MYFSVTFLNFSVDECLHLMMLGTGFVRGSARTVDLASTLRQREITINKEPRQNEGRYWSPKESLKRREVFSESGRPYPRLTNKHDQRGSKREERTGGYAPDSWETSLRSVAWISVAMPTRLRRSASLEEANSIFCLILAVSGALVGRERKEGW